MENIFSFVVDILSYILNLRLTDIPLLVAYIGISIAIGRCLGIIVISFPISIYEEFAKKKVDYEKQENIINKVSACITIIIILFMLCGLATKN